MYILILDLIYSILSLDSRLLLPVAYTFAKTIYPAFIFSRGIKTAANNALQYFQGSQTAAKLNHKHTHSSVTARERERENETDRERERELIRV